MKMFFPEELERYAADHTTQPHPLLDQVERETLSSVPDSQMLTGVVEGTFLKMLIRISGTRKAVEIGTYTGYSALMIAEALPPDGELITCEVDEFHAGIARRNFSKSPFADRIRLVVGPAIQTLKTIPDSSTGFVFIDADKGRYPKYYEESLRILKQGGLIAIDNIFWSGRILHPEDEDTRAIAELNDKVRRDQGVEKVMLSIRDGIYLIRKK